MVFYKQRVSYTINEKCVPQVTPRGRTVDYTLGSKYLRATFNTFVLNIGNKCIKNRQDFITVVTLCKETKCN